MEPQKIRDAAERFLKNYSKKSTTTRFVVFPLVMFLVIRIGEVAPNVSLMAIAASTEPLYLIREQGTGFWHASMLALALSLIISLTIDRFVDQVEILLFRTYTASLKRRLNDNFGRRITKIATQIKPSADDPKGLSPIEELVTKRAARLQPDRRLGELILACIAIVVVFADHATGVELVGAFCLMPLAVLIYLRMFREYLRDVAPLQLALEQLQIGFGALELPFSE